MKFTASAILFFASLPCLQATPLAAGLSPRVPTSKTTTTGTTSTYNVLKPNVGCIPATCGAKCKRDREEREADQARGLLPRADAPVTPAAKTADGLNAWTKEVYASAPKDLNIGTPPPPTVQFFTWAQLGTTKFVTLAGLFGCTSVVVVSDCGVYMTHHWDNTVSDDSYKEYPTMFANAFTNPLKGLGKATATAAELKDSGMTQTDFDDYFPTTGWKSLKTTEVAQCFDATNKPQAAVIIHDGLGEDGSKLPAQFATSGPAMQKLVKEAVPAAQPKLVTYKNAGENIQKSAAKPASQAGSNNGGQTSGQTSDHQGSTSGQSSTSSTASAASIDKADYHGKVIVSYDKTTKKYQVWMAGSSLTGPILHSA